MAYVDWAIKGMELSTCNCDWGCPCQFNALPTHGDCRATVAFSIEEGHFGETRLDGLNFCGMFAWPKAVHEGNGECLPIVDKKADEAQRAAILSIMSGLETEPGTTIFNVFAATYTKVHDPVFEDIQFEADLESRTGSFTIPGLVAVTAEPIRNPVTGDPHRARVVLPEGFEYTEAEYASGTAKSERIIDLDWSGAHCHIARIDMNTNGVNPA